MPDPVIKTIDVPCNPEAAFRGFTERFSDWWPRDRHSVSAMSQDAPAKAVTLDPREGGAIRETAADGSDHLWGTVQVFAPFSRLVLAWHIDRPASEASQVELRFAPTASGTRVTLTHSGWEVFGDKAQSMRDGYNQGWVHVFETCFAKACERDAA